jgi:2-succinyl-6-hydroxy-2,4-cyclohexadiene-1-carboxylate synthase
MKPRIVALHGFLGRGSDWDQVRANSKCGAEWICPNLFAPGAASLDPPEIDSPCWLAGYSFGARLALDWLQRKPERWRGALLLSVNPGNFQSDAERAARREADKKWADEFKSAGWDDLMLRWSAQEVFAGSSAPDRAEHDCDRGRLSAALREFSVADQFTDPLRLPSRLVIMAGARDRKFVHLQDRMRDAGFPGIFPVVAEAGHRLLLDAPDAVAAALDDLVA